MNQKANKAPLPFQRKVHLSPRESGLVSGRRSVAGRAENCEAPRLRPKAVGREAPDHPLCTENEFRDTANFAVPN